MKAIAAERPGSLKIIEREMEREPGAGEITIRLHAAGICGSDVHVLHGRSAFATYPRILGHELAGSVVKVGEGVQNLTLGDHVVIDPVHACGHCYACRTGRYNVCRNIQVLAAHVDGGFREYLTIPAAQAHVISKDVPWEYAATAEPYTIAAEATSRARLTREDTVLICGAGPIGIVILQVAKHIGARAMVMDTMQGRLDKALELGADGVVNAAAEPVAERVMEFTDGEGVNVIFEATGSIPVLEDCIAKYVSPAGRVVVLGFPTEPARIAPIDIMKRELDVIGSRLSCNQFPKVVKWIEEGVVDPSKLISHSFAFTDAQKAFDRIAQHPQDTLKVILRFAD